MTVGATGEKAVVANAIRCADLLDFAKIIDIEYLFARGEQGEVTVLAVSEKRRICGHIRSLA
jgi:hypothetical protein